MGMLVKQSGTHHVVHGKLKDGENVVDDGKDDGVVISDSKRRRQELEVSEMLVAADVDSSSELKNLSMMGSGCQTH